MARNGFSGSSVRPIVISFSSFTTTLGGGILVAAPKALRSARLSLFLTGRKVEQVGKLGVTVPSGLLRSHRTAPGTWCMIRVLEGRLLYRVLEPVSERVLDLAGAPGLVEPGVPHEVAPLGPVRFQVDFYWMTQAPRDGD